MERKRIIITGGGTAGHIYPAVAIIQYINENYPETEILFIGTGRGMEKDLIDGLGIKFEAINASGLAATSNLIRKIHVYIRFIFLLISGSARAFFIIKGFKPDFVLGTGGYVCGPVFLGAKLLGRKIVLHEQNYIPGRLNKFFARYAEFIFTSFEGSKQFFKTKDRDRKSRFVFSGNPVRKDIRAFRSLTPDYKRFELEEGRFTVIAFGGSLGAENINNSVFGLYDYYRDKTDLQFALICGKRFYDEFNSKLIDNLRPSDKLVFRLFPYITDIAAIYRITDLVIARAGATTVAEISATGIPSILVPYPAAIENHQFYNAGDLVESGKAIIILDNDLNRDVLKNNLESLLANNKEKYVNMKGTSVKGLQLNSDAVIVEKMFGSS